MKTRLGVILMLLLFSFSITTYGDQSVDQNNELVINVNIINSVIGNPSEEETFHFNLINRAGDATSTEIKGDGTTSASLRFTRSGTYTYTVSEEPGSAAGYDYDLSKHEVKFLIMQDLEGIFTYDVYVDGTKTDYPDISFTNYYNSPPPTYVNISLLRMNNGRIPESATYVVGAELHIEDLNGNIARDSITGAPASWTTTDHDYTVALKSVTYKLVMDAVPTALKQYYTVSSDITFSVCEDGSIADINGNRLIDNTIKMYTDFNLSAFNEDQTCGAGIHSWKELRRTEPTCGEKGSAELQCEKCHVVKTESLPPTGKHIWNSVAIKEATSEQEGLNLLTCKICGQLKTETIPKTNAVIRKDQTMVVKAKSPSVKASKLKKKKQTIKKTKAFTIKNAQGAVTFRKKSGSKKLSISSKGVITVKKGTKKGTYKMVVVVTAAGNAAYKAGAKMVTVKVKVK